LRARLLVIPVLVLALLGTRAFAATPTSQVAPSGTSLIDPELASAMQQVGPDGGVFGIVHFSAQARHGDALTSIGRVGLHVVTDFAAVNDTYVWGPAKGFTALSNTNGVTRLEFARSMKLDNTTAAWATRVRTMSDLTGGLDLRVKDANGHYIDGTGVGVAVVDAGANALHPDLSWCGSPTADQNTCKTKKNFKIKCPTLGLIVDPATKECISPERIFQTLPSPVGVGIPQPGYVMEDVPDSDTTSGHGTHVSGIATGDGTASHGLYRGTAPGAKLYAFGAGDGDSIFTIDAAVAFQWILDNGAQQSPPIKVINNSYGNPGFYDAQNPDLLSQLANKLIDNGVTVVWAAGNSGASPCTATGSTTADIPCTGPDANNPKPGNISVANYNDNGTGTRDGALDSSSSQGFAGRPDTNPDFSAPGDNIISACNIPSAACDNPAFGFPAPGYEPYYTHLSGTSMAAPHTTGVIADLYQADPTITPAQVEKLLKDTAHRFVAGAAYNQVDPTDADTPTSIDKGHGLIDARAAVLRAMQLPADTGLSGGSATTVVAQNDGGDTSTDSLDLTTVKVHEVHGGEPSNVPGAPSGDRIELMWDVAGTSKKPSAAPFRYQLTGSVDGAPHTFSVDWDGTTASCTQDLANQCVATWTPTSFIASYDAAAFGTAQGAPFFDLVATAWGDIQNAPDAVKAHCNGSNDFGVFTLNTDMPSLCADDRAPGVDTVPPAAIALTTAPLRGTSHIFTFTATNGASTCGPNSPEIVDPEGDATAFLVDLGLVPSDPSLDVRQGRITFDPKARSLTFHIDVQKLSSSAPTGATGKLFRFEFNYAGTTYEVQAESDDAAGTTSYTIDAANAAGTFGSVAGVAEGMSGAFDTGANEIRVVMPLALFDSSIAAFDNSQTPAIKPPPPLDWGSAFSNLVIQGQREIGTSPIPGHITPTADTATGTCGYTIGSDLGVTPPKVVDDTATTTQPDPVTVNVLANDSDPSGGTLHVSDVSAPSHGTAVKNADDTVTYTPSTGFYGIDSFTYAAEDAAGVSDRASVTVTVAPFCPMSPSGTFTDTLEPNPDPRWTFDTSADVDPTTHFEDPQDLTWSVISDSSAHAPSQHSFFTDDSISTNMDDRLVSPPVDIAPESKLSFWHRFTFEAPANDPTGTGVQQNDGTFFDAGVLEVSIDHGHTWQDVGADSFEQGGYNGHVTDTSGYALQGRPAWGGSSGPNMSQVVVGLGKFAGSQRLLRWRFANDSSNAPSADTPVADGWYVDDISFTGLTQVSQCGPQARSDSATTDFQKSTTIDVLANDFDPDGDTVSLSGADATSAHGGTITKNGDNTLTYTPASSFSGADTFNYTIKDPAGDTGTGVVSITVNPSPPPVAVDDSASTKFGQPVTVAVLANDSSPDGPIHIASLDAQSAHGGALAQNPDGTVTYTPAPGFSGADTFGYTIADASGQTDGATVTINVAANNAPVASDDDASTKFGTPVTVPVLANDSDPDGDVVSIASFDATSAHGGSVTKNADGTLTYTPAPNFSGTDTFSYTAADPFGATDGATVTIDVAADPSPNAFDDTAQVKAGKTVVINVLANDSDPDGEPLTIVTADSRGTNGGKVVVNKNGTISYTAPKKGVKTDTFTYTISDPYGGTDTATVTVKISAAKNAKRR